MSAKIMVLGVFHFGEHGSHLIEADPEDILCRKKQNEIANLIELISRFKPTKIAVEVNRKNSEKLNELYRGYKEKLNLEENDLITERNEVYQLAFPIAKKFNHSQVFAVDYPVELPTESLRYAAENNPDIFKIFMNDAQTFGKNINEKLQNETVVEVLRYLNDPARVDDEHSSLYLRMAQIGANTTYDGAKTLNEWYKRNIYIFSNLQSICKAEDRLLVIYGAGHIKILSEMIGNYKEMELMKTVEFLG